MLLCSIFLLLFFSEEVIGIEVANFPPDLDFPSHTPLPSCFTEFTTWSTHESTDIIPDVTDMLTCQDHCLQSPNCDQFTWYNQMAMPLDSTCFLFSHPTTEYSCANCVSGPPSCTCSGVFSCRFSDDVFVGEISDVETEILCQDHCLKEEFCNFYSWLEEDLFPKLCLMFSSCEEKQFNCDTCHSGPPDCKNASIITSTSTATTTTNPTTTEFMPTTSFHVICNSPKSQKHGDWFCPPSSDPPTCHLECHPGYISTNVTVITCQDGQWTEDPVCTTAVAIITGGYNAESSVEVYGENLHKTLPDLPDNRRYHSLQFVNSVLLLCGGSYTPTSCLSFTSSQQWTSHSTTTTGRYIHCSVSMMGQLHLLGGSSSHSTTEHLTPAASQQWTTGFDLLEPTQYACAAKIGPEEFVITGGADNQYNSVVLYNVTSGAATKLQNLITPTYDHGCVFVRDLDNGFRGVLVAGGYGSSYISESEIYDINVGEWASTGPLTKERSGVRLVVLGDKILALGGENGHYLTSMDQFNLTTKKWSVGEPMLVARADFALAPVPLSVAGLDKN